MSCPRCSFPLENERIPNLTVLEYSVECENCGWASRYRSLKCGGCHGAKLFIWEKEQWVCTICGNIRKSSPPKTN
jgi:hypothetical protein